MYLSFYSIILAQYLSIFSATALDLRIESKKRSHSPGVNKELINPSKRWKGDLCSASPNPSKNNIDKLSNESVSVNTEEEFPPEPCTENESSTHCPGSSLKYTPSQESLLKQNVTTRQAAYSEYHQKSDVGKDKYSHTVKDFVQMYARLYGIFRNINLGDDSDTKPHETCYSSLYMQQNCFASEKKCKRSSSDSDIPASL